MPFAVVNEIQLRYEINGSGTPVIFLHGLGSSADDWALQVPVFAERHRVITLDLRAHGQSGVRQPLTVDAMASDVAGLLAQLNTGPAHVIALSLGGCVALALGIHHPECVRSLTLVNTFAKFPITSWRGLQRAVQRFWLLQFRPIQELAQFVAAGLFPHPDQRWLYEAAVMSLSKNSRQAYWAALHAIRRFDARARLKDIRCPTLVMIGERDTTVPRVAGEYLAQAIPGARRFLMPNSGHASPMDQPEMFNAEVLEFLEAVERLAIRD